jgi:hypothetical protein
VPLEHGQDVIQLDGVPCALQCPKLEQVTQVPPEK